MSLTGARVEPRLPAIDLDRAIAWYHDKLGLDPSERRPGAVRYATAGGFFCLFTSTGRSDGSFTQLCLEVDDLHAEVSRLRGRRVRFQDYRTARFETTDGIAQINGNYPSKGTGELAAWFHDSENNLIGLAQTVPAPAG